MTSNRSVFKSFFLGVWRLIDGTRKLALNLIFLGADPAALRRCG